MYKQLIKVLASNGNYTLLQDVNAKFQPYIVAYGYNGENWIQGHYFSSKKEALEFMGVLN